MKDQIITVRVKTPIGQPQEQMRHTLHEMLDRIMGGIGDTGQDFNAGELVVYTQAYPLLNRNEVCMQWAPKLKWVGV